MRRGTYISCCSYRNHNHMFIVEERMINDLKSYLQRNWQGGIAGGIGGLIATWLYQRMGYSLTFALVDTSGLINKVVGAGTTAQSLAFTKVGAVMIILGAVIGMVADQHLPEGWYKIWL